MTKQEIKRQLDIRLAELYSALAMSPLPHDEILKLEAAISELNWVRHDVMNGIAT